MRAVIDTNVLISATFWTGRPKQLLNKIRHGEIIFLTSQILLDELNEILVRADKPFKLSEEEAEQLVETMRNLAEVIQPHSRVSICRDENDNRVLECAMDGRTEWIISGDLHLLELQSFQGVKIVTVGDFLNQLERDA